MADGPGDEVAVALEARASPAPRAEGGGESRATEGFSVRTSVLIGQPPSTAGLTFGGSAGGARLPG
jgi:hypothetical protein